MLILAFTQSEKDSSLMIIALYVDDILLASNEVNLLEAEKNVLETKFEMEDQGEATYCLGMAIKRERDKKILNINQKSYLESVLKDSEWLIVNQSQHHLSKARSMNNNRMVQNL